MAMRAFSAELCSTSGAEFLTFCVDCFAGGACNLIFFEALMHAHRNGDILPPGHNELLNIVENFLG